MRLEHLHHIIEIEKHKSISQTAKSLYISQPSLSASLSNLEQEIGVKIFQRSALGVEPTPEGKDILALAKEIVENTERILNYTRESSELTGEVHLLSTQAYSFLFSDVMMQFRSHYPKANLVIMEKMPMEIVEDIQRGMANIGITTWELFPEQTQNILQEKHIQYESFGRRQMMLYVSANSRFVAKGYASLQELKNEQFVAYASSYWDSANEQVHANKPPMIMTDRENLKRLVSDGHAVALMPETFAIHDIYCQQGLIKVLPIDQENEITGVDYLLYPKRKELTVLEKGLCNIIRSILQQLDLASQ